MHKGVVSWTTEETQRERYSLLDRHSENKQIWVHSKNLTSTIINCKLYVIIQVPLIAQPVILQLTAQ
jgi:hypothetical protein